MTAGRRLLIATLAVAAVAAVGATVAPSLLGSGPGAAATSSSSTGTPEGADAAEGPQDRNETSEVVVRTLTDEAEFNGDLGFGDQRELSAGAPGTLTWLPDEGTVLRPGDVLWEVDRQPTIYLQGEIPMYRELYRGVAKGDDVTQLEQALVDAGYGPDGWQPDTTFNTTTRNAVKAFQKDHGMTQTGRLDASHIVYGTETLRVADTAHRGDRADAGATLTVTAPEATVTVNTSSRQLATLQRSPEVLIEFADGGELPARLDDTEATPAGDDGSFGYRVTYEVDGAVGEAQPVKVKIVRILAEDALTVPVDALLALAEGGYAVEVVTSRGPVLRAVEVIDFDDTTVAVEGDLEVGDRVVVP